MTRIFKIVRDKIPQMVDEATQARHPKFHSIDEFTYGVRTDLWVGKLQEELDELKEAAAKEDWTRFFEEYVDLADVLEAMAKDMKMPPLSIGQQHLKKHQERGGFDDGTVMEWDAE